MVQMPKSGLLKNRTLDFGKSDSNNTDINNTDLNKTDISSSSRISFAALEREMEKDRDVIKTNIEYDILLLLNNYRDMKLARELQRIEKEVGYDQEILCSPEEFAEETGITNIDYAGNERKLTIKAIKLINRAVKDIRENEEEGEIYYWVLYYTYLCDKVCRTNECFEKAREKVELTSYTKYYCYHHMAIELMRQRLKM